MKIVTARPLTFPRAANRPSGAAVDVSCVLPGYSSLATAEFQSDFFIAPRRFPLCPTRRLVVVIPEGNLDESALARRIWQLASACALQVLLLGLSTDDERASAVRRRLALLSAILRQGQVSTSTTSMVGRNWPLALKAVLRSGDLVVSLARHKVAYHAVHRQSLGEALAAVFDIPVYMLGELEVGQSPAKLESIRSMAAWGISIVILLAFAGLQIWLSQNIDPRLSPVLLGFSIIAEGITLLKTIEWIG